ncbi:MAG: hypothetical protein KBS74_02175, partial [Clostridiales bacterium]|nr:hypothetical protein [Candidatus Cacconaster stercorequi]
MAVSIELTITQNSQSIADNASNVTVKLSAKWTYGSWNGNAQPGWVKINGTKYSFTHSFNAGRTTSGNETIFSKNIEIEHNTDGTKTLSCSASYDTGVSSGTVTDSASKTLTTIPRESSISCGDITIGKSGKITVTRKSSALTHTIRYAVGNKEGTICTKSNDTSISWVPPISLVTQLDGSYKTCTLTVTTYNGDTKIGDGKSIGIKLYMPAASSIQCSNVTLGNSVKITISRAHSEFTHKVVASIADKGYSSTLATKAGAGLTWTPSRSIADYIKDASSDVAKVTVTTYYGSKEIGSKYINVTLYVPSDMKPTISAKSLTVVNGNTTVAGWGVAVQGYSKLKYSATASGIHGSTIKKYSVTLAGKTYTGSSATTPTIKTAGTYSAKITVTDSRGRTATAATSGIEVLPYKAPTVKSAEAYRSNQSGGKDTAGGYIACTMSATGYSVGGKNTINRRVRYRVSGGDWGSYYTLTDNQKRIINAGILATKSYDVEIYAVDTLGNKASVIKRIPTDSVTMNLRKGGGGVAFGKYSEQAGLECAWPAYFTGRARFTANDSLSTAAAEICRTGSGAPNIRFKNDSAGLGCVGMMGTADGSSLYRWSSDMSRRYEVYDSGNFAIETLPNSAFTAKTTYGTNHSIKMRYIAALGVVLFHGYVVFGSVALSARTAAPIGTVASGYRPGQQEALSVICTRIGNATVKTDGTVQVILNNAVAAGSTYPCYITGFWFV